MKLLIGLGNPGKEYANTRHNAGFVVLDEIKNLWAFPIFQENKKFSSEISEGFYLGEKIILAKPQTFMNVSGTAVRALMDFYKLDLSDITILQDDLDIDFGAFKVSTDSSAGGHNGILDIIEKVGTQKFKRIRIGIEGPEAKKMRTACGKNFVLGEFSQTETDALKNLAAEIAKNL
jgi:PTH1 family peptidyl-tRNA hydrolase